MRDREKGKKERDRESVRVCMWRDDFFTSALPGCDLFVTDETLDRVCMCDITETGSTVCSSTFVAVGPFVVKGICKSRLLLVTPQLSPCVCM